MMSFWAEFHFLRPWLLLLLVIPFVVYFMFLKTETGASSWARVCDKPLLQFLLIKSKGTHRKQRIRLMLLGLTTAVLAAAGPAFQKTEHIGVIHENPVAIMLDMSSDMLKTSGNADMLQRAKIEIASFLKMLPDSQTGLIVYSGEPYLISPFSTDVELIINLLPAILPEIMPDEGNRLDRAINFAVERFEQASYKQGNIVVFTSSAGTDRTQALEAAQNAAKQNYNVSVIDMSSAQDKTLRQIAAYGNGAFGNMVTGAQKAKAQVENTAPQDWSETKNPAQDYEDAGYYLLFIPLLCCLYFFRVGVLGLLIILSWSLPAEAGFWLSDNAQAKRLFDATNYDAAASKFKDVQWKGASYYRAGDFEKAAQAFQEQNHLDTESLYNYANALAKAGKLDKAAEAYQRVLDQDSMHEDARFNLEYIKKLQQQQQQSKNGENDEHQKNQSAQKDKENESDNTQNMEEFAGQESRKDKENNQNNEAQNSGQGQNNEEQKSEDNQNEDNTDQNKDSSNDMATMQQSAPLEAQEGKSDEIYDETAQAREQIFRQIPEDKGGLLRAFIRKEYLKNRYGE